MGPFQIALSIATFLCSLVAGFLFAFAVVVMPGIKSLGDREFIRAFQVIDGIIRTNQPVFMCVWIGSALALLATAVLGMGHLDGADRLLIIITTLVYVLGVQLPTIIVNVPLNNRLQTLDVQATDEHTRRAAREHFEPRWNRWNVRRTAVASLVSALLVVMLSRI